MKCTIERAQIASVKRATLYGPKGVEHSLFISNETTNETRIASTIRQALLEGQQSQPRRR